MEGDLHKTFSEDVVNAVCDYCADGIDAFERCLEGAPLLDADVKANVHKGAEMLGGALITKMEAHLLLFQQFCAATVFRAPALVYSPSIPRTETPRTPGLSPARFSSSAPMTEQEMDAKLNELRTELLKVHLQSSQLQREVYQLDLDIQKHGHLATHAAAISSVLNITSGVPVASRGVPSEGVLEAENKENEIVTVSSGKEVTTPAIAANVAAISEAVARLQPLLQRAQKLRSNRRHPYSATTMHNEASVDFISSQMVKTCGDLQDVLAVHSMMCQGH
ncbi:hypothetical protein CEUSTIGMA_g5749.t1 [Chlamydomonas eustigma]|uniref:Uncharacterized protein n=1 Tax=Chlamydomonas eustigma TaxID=1157962 RepID=A0A250X5D6_9CHLO|nr:hypothetical protein CEUSTIGMA_g5749.t1 [Chlamydomonas eustigma]|eukprot:GAX78307.1 hypothetical protein CEUSTIGMA_g5749.t1 [Chlamydomonas eustigma]